LNNDSGQYFTAYSKSIKVIHGCNKAEYTYNTNIKIYGNACFPTKGEHDEWFEKRVLKGGSERTCVRQMSRLNWKWLGMGK